MLSGWPILPPLGFHDAMECSSPSRILSSTRTPKDVLTFGLGIFGQRGGAQNQPGYPGIDLYPINQDMYLYHIQRTVSAVLSHAAVFFISNRLLLEPLHARQLHCTALPPIDGKTP